MSVLIEVEKPYELHFREAPPSTFRKQFVNFLAGTSRPENFPGLSKDPPPDKLTGAVMVHKFTVDGANRAGERIPCALCKGRPKFFYGALYWFPQDGRVRLIGNCCAEKYDPEGFQIADNARTFTDLLDESTEYLEKSLGSTPILRTELMKLEGISETITLYRNELKTLSSLYGKLRQTVRRHSRELRVMIPVEQTEVRKFLQDEGVVETANEVSTVIHVIEGPEFLDESFDPHYEYQVLLSFFTGLQGSCGDPTAMLIGLLDDSSKVIKLAKDFENHVSRIDKLRRFLADAVNFFSVRNLAGLNKYGRHKHTDLPFAISLDADIIRIELRQPRIGSTFKVGPALTVPTISLPI